VKLESKVRKYKIVDYKFVGYPHQKYTPMHATEGASGADLKCSSLATVDIHPYETVKIKTGICIEIPEGYEGQLRPRSGLSVKTGIIMLPSVGTIDSDYRGEISITYYNPTQKTVHINPEERIAQLIIAPYERCIYNYKTELTETVRGSGGFGSTGQ